MGRKEVVGFVYFATADGWPIKIGWTTNPTARLRSLRACCPVSIRFLTYIPGDKKMERQLHRRFSSLKFHGEWFSRGDELMAFIDSLPSRPLESRKDRERRIGEEAWQRILAARARKVGG